MPQLCYNHHWCNGGNEAAWRITVGCVHEHITRVLCCDYCHNRIVAESPWVCAYCRAPVEIYWEKL